AQLQQGQTKLWSEQRRERPTFGSFETDRLNAQGSGVLPHLVEEDGLPDSTKTHHEHALGGPAGTTPLDRDSHPAASLLAARELGWRRSGTWCKGIADRVHAGRVYAV